MCGRSITVTGSFSGEPWFTKFTGFPVTRIVSSATPGPERITQAGIRRLRLKYQYLRCTPHQLTAILKKTFRPV